MHHNVCLKSTFLSKRVSFHFISTGKCKEVVHDPLFAILCAHSQLPIPSRNENKSV
jgi:hypothetical protein